MHVDWKSNRRWQCKRSKALYARNIQVLFDYFSCILFDHLSFPIWVIWSFYKIRNIIRNKWRHFLVIMVAHDSWRVGYCVIWSNSSNRQTRINSCSLIHLLLSHSDSMCILLLFQNQFTPTSNSTRCHPRPRHQRHVACLRIWLTLFFWKTLLFNLSNIYNLYWLEFNSWVSWGKNEDWKSCPRRNWRRCSDECEIEFD